MAARTSPALTEQERAQERERKREKKSRISKRTLGGLALGGASLALLYALRDKIKNFRNWEESVEETSQNSADMLIGKLNLAQELSAVKDPDLEGVRSSLLIAKKEARKLSKLNREFEKRLGAFSSLPDKLS